MTGYSLEEIRKVKSLLDIVLEEDQIIIREKIKECLVSEEEKKEELRFRLVNKKKGFVWVHMTIHKLQISQKQVLFIASFVDVTREMENSYVLMEATDRCICVIEKATKRFLYANSQFYDLIDLTPAKAKGKHCYEVLCKSLEMRTNDNCLCYSSINVDEAIETYNPEKKKYLTMSGREIIWGEHEAYVFYLTDITKEKQKDEMLEDSIKRFNVALDNSDLMIWEYDMINNRCINSEKAGRDYDIPLIIENYPESLFLTGYTPPETIEQIKDVKRRLQNGETGFSVERRTIDKYGKSNWQKVDYSLECDEKGNPVRAIVCGIDITAKKELERKYEEQKEYRNNLAKKSMFSTRLDLEDNSILDYTCNEENLHQMMEQVTNADEFLKSFFQTSIFTSDSQMSKEFFTLMALRDKFTVGQRQYHTMYQCSLLNKYLEMNLTMTQNPGNNHLEAFLIVLDVTDNAFMHDTLTGLYNRQKSYLECRRVMNEHPDETFVMVHFDIQRFRLYNSFLAKKKEIVF